MLDCWVADYWRRVSRGWSSTRIAGRKLRWSRRVWLSVTGVLSDLSHSRIDLGRSLASGQLDLLVSTTIILITSRMSVSTFLSFLSPY